MRKFLNCHKITSKLLEKEKKNGSDTNLFKRKSRRQCVLVNAACAVGAFPKPTVFVVFNCSQEKFANLKLIN